MKYHLISVNTDEKIIGCYPQTAGLPKGYTDKWLDSPNSMTNLSDNSLPSFTPDLKWKLKSDAILTDIISATNITSTGFLMSQKAKSIFECFHTGVHIYHKAHLIYNKQLLQYYYLQLVHRTLQDINFSSSAFYLSNLFGIKQSDITLTSEYELTEKQHSLPVGQMIRAEKIVFGANHQHFDLFFFPVIHNEVFASEILVKELQKENISGIEYIQQNIIRS